MKTLQEDKRTEDGRVVDTRIGKRDGFVDSGLWTEEGGVDSGPWTEVADGPVPSATSIDVLSDDSDVS